MPERQTMTAVALGEFAHGTIEPAPRVEAGEITEDEIDEFVEALDGDELYHDIESFIPKCCVDGRHRADGACKPGANAAGGVFSLVVADMLLLARHYARMPVTPLNMQAMYSPF